MATDVQLTGANFPLPLSGQEFQAKTLTDKDYEEINAYIQSKIIELGRSVINPNMLPEERKEINIAAISAAAGITWDMPEGRRIMTSIEGMCRLAWQMTKHHHTNLTFEKLCDHIRGKGPEILRVNLEQIDNVFLTLNTNMKKEDEEEVAVEDTSVQTKSE